MPASASENLPLEFARARALGGIEMRDAFNQVVARSAVDRGIRRGVRAQEERAASLSSLPGLRELLAYLDELDSLAPKLDAPGRGAAARISAFAHRVPKRAALKTPSLRSFPLAPAVSALTGLHPLQLRSTPGRVRVLPLLL